MYDEKWAKVHFWLTVVGFHLTFLVQHWLGNAGMPRRYYDYLPTDGFTGMHVVSTIGSFILGVSFLPFVWTVWKSYRTGPVVEVDDPWGHGNSLEWATSSPPPLRNFDRMPRIRSERPAFDAKFPHLAVDTSKEAREAAARGRPAPGKVLQEDSRLRLGEQQPPGPGEQPSGPGEQPSGPGEQASGPSA